MVFWEWLKKSWQWLLGVAVFLAGLALGGSLKRRVVVVGENPEKKKVEEETAAEEKALEEAAAAEKARVVVKAEETRSAQVRQQVDDIPVLEDDLTREYNYLKEVGDLARGGKGTKEGS
jgi:hypothetical protein